MAMGRRWGDRGADDGLPMTVACVRLTNFQTIFETFDRVAQNFCNGFKDGGEKAAPKAQVTDSIFAS